ncbi:MAG: phosphatidylserine decarboxylase family protein [Rikenellaceae bacterium]
MRIHKEGYSTITVFAIIALALATGLYFWIPWVGYAVLGVGVLKVLFVMRFFRVPRRETPAEDTQIVYSPCDGKVVAIEEVYEKEYLKEKVLQVSVFMSVNNVHINWFPVSGEVKYFKHHQGKYLVAWAEKSSEINERTTTVVETKTGHQVLFRQIAGFVARRIVNRTKVGQQAVQCTECGFIKFGSRMDVFLPLGTEVLVKIDQKVTGIQTALARLPK